MADYYQILGVKSNASLDDIIIAYRNKIANTDTTTDEGKIALGKIGEAFYHLGSENRRRQYDYEQAKQYYKATGAILTETEIERPPKKYYLTKHTSPLHHKHILISPFSHRKNNVFPVDLSTSEQAYFDNMFSIMENRLLQNIEDRFTSSIPKNTQYHKRFVSTSRIDENGKRFVKENKKITKNGKTYEEEINIIDGVKTTKRKYPDGRVSESQDKLPIQDTETI